MLKFEIGKPIEAFNATPSRIKPIQSFETPEPELQGYQVRQPNGEWIEVQNAVEANYSGALSYTLEGSRCTANAGEWRSPVVAARLNSITTKAIKRRVYLTLGFLALLILIILRILLQVAAEI